MRVQGARERPPRGPTINVTHGSEELGQEDLRPDAMGPWVGAHFQSLAAIHTLEQMSFRFISQLRSSFGGSAGQERSGGAVSGRTGGPAEPPGGGSATAFSPSVVQYGKFSPNQPTNQSINQSRKPGDRLLTQQRSKPGPLRSPLLLGPATPTPPS